MTFKRKSTLITICLTFISTLSLSSQSEIPQDWHHLPTEHQKYKGVSTEEALKLLENRLSETVIVAVIDSGIDHDHEDLKDIMWVNEDEVAGNGIDDDNNGYIDDTHGWSFLGNPNGENITGETLEETRIFAAGKDFKGKREVYAKAIESYVSSRENYLSQ